MRRILVIGLTGQVGDALRPHLSSLGECWAVSRRAPAASAGIHWLSGLLQAMPPLPERLDTVISLGPLDAFADWFSQSGLSKVRVVALGSTGREDKRESRDPEEQGVALALSRAELGLFETGRRQAAEVTLLRPTLIYGHGRDASLTPMLALARRWGFVVLPAGASGLRQPVHVDDVAGAIVDCLDAPAAVGRCFDLPGGERLSFREMIARSLARNAPGARVVTVPRVLFRALLAFAGRVSTLSLGSGFLERTRRDQTADIGPAAAAFGFQPRLFEP